MKKKIFPLLVLAVLTAIGASTATLSMVESREVLRPEPFTIDMATHYFDTRGMLHSTQKHKVAFRRDGSTSRLDFLQPASGILVERKKIYDLAAGYKYIALSAGESVSSYPLSDGRVQSIRSEAYRCGNFFSKTDRVLEYDVVLVQSDFSDAYPDARSVRGESWHAPSLGCAQLKLDVILTETDGTERFLTTVVAENVTLGDPDESLFTVPPGYVERPPGVAIREIGRLYPAFPIDGAEDLLDLLDDRYFESVFY